MLDDGVLGENEHFELIEGLLVGSCRAGDDFPPLRKFTADEVRRMSEIGVLREDENVELIEGELIMMAAKGIAHERIKNFLTKELVRAAPDTLLVGVENTFQLGQDVIVEPDLAIVAAGIFRGQPTALPRPNPRDIVLLIEIAVSSLDYDRKVKAAIYARHGVREFWVIDANERKTFVHTGPSGDGWSSIVERGPTDALTPAALPGLAVRLADID